MSGVMPALLEAEERAAATAAHLDVVDDQQDPVLAGEPLEARAATSRQATFTPPSPWTVSTMNAAGLSSPL